MKKIITMIMVMAMIIGTFAVNASALCLSEEGRPDIIGIDLLDEVKELEELYEEEGREYEYDIGMINVEGYWIVVLEGWADEVYDYSAYGIYDHMPNEEEIDILWANRMTDDEYDILCEKYGI